MTLDAALQARVARLRRELKDEIGVEITEEALEELAYCRFVEPHEGDRPTYGAVIWTSELPPHLAGVPPLPSPAGYIDTSAPLEVLRTFADGRTSFVIRGPGVVPGIAIDPAWVGSELALATHANALEVTIVQRLATGRIRLYHDDHVYSEEGGIWLTRPTALTYYETIAVVVEPRHQATARAILDMCVHTLSPAGHGATLVWFPGGAGGKLEYLDMSVAIAPPALSVVEASHASAIAHALGQLDRAAIVDADGRFIHLNVSLSNSSAADEISFEGGTRHNSAGRYSASQPDAIVFVVSADGPVTVFHSGDVVASIEYQTPQG